MNDAQEVEAAQAQVELAQGSARARAHLEIEARAQVSAIAWRLPACLPGLLDAQAAEERADLRGLVSNGQTGRFDGLVFEVRSNSAVAGGLKKCKAEAGCMNGWADSQAGRQAGRREQGFLVELRRFLAWTAEASAGVVESRTISMEGVIHLCDLSWGSYLLQVNKFTVKSLDFFFFFFQSRFGCRYRTSFFGLAEQKQKNESRIAGENSVFEEAFSGVY